MGEGNQTPIKHLVYQTITSRFNANDIIQDKAYLLMTMSTRLPSNISRLIVHSFKHYRWLTLHVTHRAE